MLLVVRKQYQRMFTQHVTGTWSPHIHLLGEDSGWLCVFVAEVEVVSGFTARRAR